MTQSTLAEPERMRCRIALLGVFAILLQAILFGWHHHPIEFAGGDGWPALTSQQNGAPLSPATDEDGCELCAALHYLTAAPGEFILAAAPPSPVLPRRPAAPVRCEHSPNLSFRARAPPLA